MPQSDLSNRAQLLKPSPTLAVSTRALIMRREGKDVISFAAGQPDFSTPEPIAEEAIAALRRGDTKYTPTRGTPELREAVVAKLKRENKIQADVSNIVVSCGAKHSLYNIFQVLLNPGDEVILFAPYWATYSDQVSIAGGIPVVLNTSLENDFQPDFDHLRSLITPKTKAIVVNTPSNPTGAAFTRQTIKQIATVALKNDLWIISDEIYERLTYGHDHESLAALSKEVGEKTITVTGVSKTYAMTGWRIGFACAPPDIAQAMSNLQDQVTSGPTSFAQAGAVAALELPTAEVEKMRDTFRERRDVVLERLRAMPDVEVATPKGAFYVFPDLSRYIGGKVGSDMELVEYLLEEALIATVPGSVFAGPGHIRISYATNPEQINQGMDRMQVALSKLRE